MEVNKNLPAIQTNPDDLTLDQQREYHKKEVEKYETALLNDLKTLKRDFSRLAIVIGTAYVAYRFTRYFLKSSSQPSAPPPQENQAYAPTYKQNGHISVEQETPKPKKSFSIKSLIKRKLTTIALDILKEKLQEEIIKYNKKNAK